MEGPTRAHNDSSTTGGPGGWRSARRRADARSEARRALRECSRGEITLADAVKLLSPLAASPAAAAVVAPDFPPTRHSLHHRARTSTPRSARSSCNSALPAKRHRVGRSPAAHVAPSAQLADDVDVHPLASIGEDVVIGSGTVIHSGVHVMAGCRIGRGRDPVSRTSWCTRTRSSAIGR